MSSGTTNASERIKADLIRRIDAGDFDGHRTLPSELRLAAEYE